MFDGYPMNACSLQYGTAGAAGRMPRLLLRFVGGLALRLAERQLRAALLKLPPRLTRWDPFLTLAFIGNFFSSGWCIVQSVLGDIIVSQLPLHAAGLDVRYIFLLHKQLLWNSCDAQVGFFSFVGVGTFLGNTRSLLRINPVGRAGCMALSFPDQEPLP